MPERPQSKSEGPPAENYYEILGVPSDADEETIRRAYRKLAMKHHPDKGGDEVAFRRINESYEVLMDLEKRKAYDRKIGLEAATGRNKIPSPDEKRERRRQQLENTLNAGSYELIGKRFRGAIREDTAKRKSEEMINEYRARCIAEGLPVDEGLIEVTRKLWK